MTATVPSPSTTEMLDQVLGDVAGLTGSGQVATYIPALARVPRRKLAVSTADIGGSVHGSGNYEEKFSIQSIHKIFSLTVALAQSPGSDLWERVWREPSGDPFNSVVLLERENGVPRNPLINAGAIVVADLLIELLREDPVGTVCEMLSELSGSQVEVDSEVADSEAETGFRNRSLANLLKSYGNLTNEVEVALDVYFRLSGIAMTTAELATATRFLANDGVDPISGKQILSAQDARRVNSLMLMAGTYDAAGAFAYEIGIPCKSGVGGGIVGVVPEVTSVCVWSPGLDETGNSLAGRAALASFVKRSGLSVF